MQNKKKLITYLIVVVLFIVLLGLLIISNKKSKEKMPEAPATLPTNLPQVLGDKDNFISFSITPRSEVTGKIVATGVIKGGYFFEGNVIVRIVDATMKEIGAGTDTKATTDWMTAGPVTFQTTLDFTNLPKGPGYVKVMADDPRDASERGNAPIKQILIPVIIK